MKKFLLLILLFPSIAISQKATQKYYGSAGFGYSFMNSNELNSIVNLYNSNPDVTEKMGKFESLFGPNILMGMKLDREKNYFNFEFGFALLFSGTQRSQISESVGLAVIREAQFKSLLINFGANYFTKTSDLIHLGAGFSLNLGSMNTFYRTYKRLTPSPEYTTLNQNSIFSYAGVTPSLFINFYFSKQFTLSVRPNYFLSLKSQNLVSLNSKLNPGKHINDLESSSFSGPGIAVNFLFKVGKK